MLTGLGKIEAGSLRIRLRKRFVHDQYIRDDEQIAVRHQRLRLPVARLDHLRRLRLGSEKAERPRGEGAADGPAEMSIPD